MQPSELRIGNHYYSYDGFGKERVDTLRMIAPADASRPKKMFAFGEIIHANPISETKPIPLTEKWLKKAGLRKKGDYWDDKHWDFELGEMGGNYVNCVNGYEYSNGNEIKYLHQL